MYNIFFCLNSKCTPEKRFFFAGWRWCTNCVIRLSENLFTPFKIAYLWWILSCIWYAHYWLDKALQRHQNAMCVWFFKAWKLNCNVLFFFVLCIIFYGVYVKVFHGKLVSRERKKKSILFIKQSRHMHDTIDSWRKKKSHKFECASKKMRDYDVLYVCFFLFISFIIFLHSTCFALDQVLEWRTVSRTHEPWLLDWIVCKSHVKW